MLYSAVCCCSFYEAFAWLRKWPGVNATRILCLRASIFIQNKMPLVTRPPLLILTHATHHLAAISSVTATCCWVQEQLHVAVLWGAERDKKKPSAWCSNIIMNIYMQGRSSKATYFKLTHVGFVFRHGCHSILVCCKFYICLPGYSAIWADLNMDPHWIQRWEELRNANKDKFTYNVRCNLNICNMPSKENFSDPVIYQIICSRSSDLHCRCLSLWLCMGGPSCGHNGPLCSGRKSHRRYTVHLIHLNIHKFRLTLGFMRTLHLNLVNSIMQR